MNKDIELQPRTLADKIDRQLYERTAISKKLEELIKKKLNQMKESTQLLPDLVFPSNCFLEGKMDLMGNKTVLKRMEPFVR